MSKCILLVKDVAHIVGIELAAIMVEVNKRKLWDRPATLDAAKELESLAYGDFLPGQ